MALHITNPSVEQKVRDLASATGESITDAIGISIDERMVRVSPQSRRQRDPSVDEVLELVRSFQLRPINESLSDDEILGYGPDGYCE